MTSDEARMTRAIELAANGEGRVEPNPMVGCVIVRDGHVVGEGWHQTYGGPHAEVEALRRAGDRAKDATMYVTLEPCCHVGKTPPCTEAVIAAGIRRVVVAQLDPFPKVQGHGIERLRSAGLTVQVGLLESAAVHLNAPYLTLLNQGRPWVIAKWAMTLDGKIASRTGHSQWISCEESRQVVHRLRGRMDAIMVGRGTAEADDPQLTARPAGERTAARIVLDSHALLSTGSRLAQSTHVAPVLIAVGPHADEERCQALLEAGCEIVRCTEDSPAERLRQLLQELGNRRMTNLLVEGGGTLLGSLFDLDLIDEVHVFIAPKLVGGRDAHAAIDGYGLSQIPSATSIASWQIQTTGSDVYVSGRLEDRQLLPQRFATDGPIAT